MTAKEMKENSKKKSSTYRINVGYLDCYQFTSDEFQAFCEQLCKEQRQLVANELKRYTEDLSIPNQYKINDLCNNAPKPEI